MIYVQKVPGMQLLVKVRLVDIVSVTHCNVSVKYDRMLDLYRP
jgi:hypothetical protein